MKAKILIPLIIISLIVLIFFAQTLLDWLPFNIYRSGLKRGTGIIVRRDVEWEEWGLEIEKGVFFKRRETLSFYQLPEEFKTTGLTVKCIYTIRDVIGTDKDWSVVIDVGDIQKVQ